MTRRAVMVIGICAAVAAGGIQGSSMNSDGRRWKELRSTEYAGKTARLSARPGAATADQKKVSDRKQEFREYGEDETVRVYIVFDREETENTSLDEMADRIRKNVFAEGGFDIQSKKLSGYDITADVPFGKIEEIRKVPGVASVKLEKAHELTESSQSEKTDPVPEKEPEQKESTETNKVTDAGNESDIREKNGRRKILAGTAGGIMASAGAAGLFWKKKKKK